MSDPDFIIAGERRSGSTLLYELTKLHPEIDMFHYSDMDFFIQDELFKREPTKDNNINEWESNYDVNNYKKLFRRTNKKNGQKDADLLWWKPAHKRLKKHLPDTKFVFVLRDPTERALSQYWNEFRKGRENRDFEQAIKDENSGQLTKWQKLHLQYKQRGCYVQSLKHFFSYVDPQLCHVITLEKLKTHKERELMKLANFLGISPYQFQIDLSQKVNKEEALVIDPNIKSKFLKNLIKFYDRLANKLIITYTKNSKKRTKLRSIWMKLGKKSAREITKIDPNLLKELRDFYKPYNRELESLINVSLKEWD